MIREMAKDNKGAAPDMGDLSDVSAQYLTVTFSSPFSTIMVVPCYILLLLYLKLNVYFCIWFF